MKGAQHALSEETTLQWTERYENQEVLPAANHIPQLLVLLSQLSDELVLTKRCLACYRALRMECGRLVPCLQCLQQGTGTSNQAFQHSLA